ncbi:AIPR family protein [Bradyrhizobium sp. SZCCHNRI20481]|uniref:AIPR family protein n=1 Tax=Bradyrhizobium sp. SZCCHNRI20481 TaxID=3057286 RepID=UPI002916A1E7|nr:AIPR family protein [Bradyrhizobium sp. SZCCHNRI20481]
MNKIVGAILAEFSKDNGIEALPEEDRFEYLTSYLTIRRHFSRALNLKDIVVGKGGDTGLDAIAIIVNGALMTDVDQVQEMLEQNGYIEATFIFVQAERSSSFDGAKIGTIGNGVEDFFRDVPQMTRNDDVQEAAEIKAAIYARAPSFRRLPNCHIYYVTTGKWTDAADLVARRNIETAKLAAPEMFDVSFTTYGADDIMRLHTSAKNAVVRTFTWDQKVKIPSISGVHLAYLGYLPAKDFVEIISDDAHDGIVGGVFYDNVRDWQDYNEVNSGIRDTVLSEKKARFVLMNNGVTIIARGFKQVGDTLTIENFQIVNGCQTSNVLFDHRDKIKDSAIQVPLRLIWTNDDNVFDSVVTGTNQQTELTPEQIYARTEFAKRLEKHFESYPEPVRLHYERRDGQYDRVAVGEKGRIVSPQNLIKVFAAMILEEPHVAAKSYKALRLRVGKEFFLEADKRDPYFLAALAAYRLEVQLRTKPLRVYKSARYHMLLAMRLLMDPLPLPHMNSKEMEKRCVTMIATLSDDVKANALIQKAKGVIDKVSGGDLSRDNVRTIPQRIRS